jgi:hypothetical protein
MLLRRELTLMRSRPRRSGTAHSPAPADRPVARPLAAPRPARPDDPSGPGAGSSTESSRLYRFYPTSRVNVVGTASPVDDHQALDSVRDDTGHEGRLVHASERRRRADSGMHGSVQPYRCHHGLPGRRVGGPPATGWLSSHADILRSRRARPGERPPGLALFRHRAARHSRIYAGPRPPACRSFH